MRTGNPILVMDPASAELTKYAANAMLATRISFMNEIANYLRPRGRGRARRCAWAWARTRASAPRSSSPGWDTAGSCFPKDVKALAAHGAGRRRRSSGWWRRGRGQRAAEAAAGGPRSPPTWAGSRGRWSRSGASPSSHDRRHARGPRPGRHRGPAGGRRERARLRSQGRRGGPAPPGRPHRSLHAQLRGGGGGGRPGRDHRVERVPGARLQADQVAHAAARDLRRPEHLPSRLRSASWASTTRGSVGGEGPGHGRRGLHRQPRRPRVPGSRATRSTVLDDLSAGHRAAVPSDVPLVTGDFGDAAVLAPRAGGCSRRSFTSRAS